jgi:hypothetical protein
MSESGIPFNSLSMPSHGKLTNGVIRMPDLPLKETSANLALLSIVSSFPYFQERNIQKYLGAGMSIEPIVLLSFVLFTITPLQEKKVLAHISRNISEAGKAVKSFLPMG